MPNRKPIVPLLLLLAAGIAAPGEAAKVYKWTDEHGNVSYHDRPPPGDAGKVEEKHIDPNRNVIESTVPTTGKKPAARGTRTPGKPTTGAAAEADETAPDTVSKRRKLEGGAVAEEGTQPPNVPPTPSIPGVPAIPSPPPPPAPPPPGGSGTF